MTLLTKEVALQLQILGFGEETEYEFYEPEEILQRCTGSDEWKPSRNILVKYPTVEQAIRWLSERVDNKSLQLSTNLPPDDRLSFLLDSL